MKTTRILSRLLSLAAVVLLSAACFEENPPESPSDENTPEWMDITPSGGTMKQDGITVTFPAGTFSADSKVGLSPIRKGSLLGEYEKSTFYKVTLPPSGSQKSFTIKIQCPEDAQDLCVVVQSPGLVRGSGEIVIATRQVAASYANGEMTVNVPVYTTDNTEESPYFAIGLVEDFLKSDETRAGNSGEVSNDQYSLRWPIYKTFTNWNKYKGENRLKILRFLNENIPPAHQVLKDFGFKWTTRSIPYQIEDFDDAWGYEVVDWLFGNFGDWYTYIKISAPKMLELVTAEVGSGKYNDYSNNLKQTLVHETFHYIHDTVYDSRLAASKSISGFAGDQWAMFSDAIACWTEKGTGDKRISENTVFFVNSLLQSFLPTTWGSTAYQHSGYAMALFTEWLSRHSSDKKIPTLLDYQKEGVGSVVEVFEKFLNTNKLTFFTFDGYRSFLDEVLAGTIDSRINLGKVFTANNTPIGTVEKKMIPDDVYSFGISVQRIRFSQPVMNGNPDKSICIEQENEGLVTYIYEEQSDGSSVLLGETRAGKPYTIRISDCLARTTLLRDFTTVTLKLAPKMDEPAIKSNIACWIDAPLTMPNIWSVGLQGDIPGSFVNEGWTNGSLSTITVTKVEDGYYVSATSNDDYYNLYFTITLKGNSFGDVINIRNERPGGSSIYNFTIDKLPLVKYDSGEDASYGYARWKGPGVGGMTMDLDIYFDPIR